MPHRKAKQTPRPHPELVALHERGETIKRKADELMRQLRELQSEIAKHVEQRKADRNKGKARKG